MSQRVVYFNGEFVDESEARVSIFDSALMFGDMAFEMTRTFNQRPFHLRRHLNRLYASLRLLEIDCQLGIDEMQASTEEVLRRNLSSESDDMDWQIMHNVLRGPLGIYRKAFGGRIEPTVTINCWPLITHTGGFAPKFRSGVHVVIPAQQAVPAQLIDPKAKTRSRMHYQLANLQVERMQGDWAVLVDGDGYLTEGTGNNVFLVKDGVLLTPEPRNILLGVSRGVTMELARRLGIDVRETNLDRYAALQADEIFCTATTFCLVHAHSFEGQVVGDGRPGPVFTRLLEAWKAEAGVDFVAQAEAYHARLADWEDGVDTEG